MVNFYSHTNWKLNATGAGLNDSAHEQQSSTQSCKGLICWGQLTFIILKLFFAAYSLINYF